MTKIKNTKKGMAKKTLSISLAVAMLATSNVPVWAAEFTDGSDAVFTSEAEVEAPVVEEEVVDKAKDISEPKTTLAITEKGWANDVTVSGDVYDKEGHVVDEFAYAWVVDGKVNTGNAGYASRRNPVKPYTPSANDIGKTVVLRIYEVDTDPVIGNDSYVAETNAVTISKANVDLDSKAKEMTLKITKDGGATYTDVAHELAYTGKEQYYNEKDFYVTAMADFENAGLSNSDFDFTGHIKNGNGVDAGSVYTVTATPKDSSKYTGTLNYDYDIVAKNFAAGDLSVKVGKTYQYTGRVITPAVSDITVKDELKKEVLDSNRVVKTINTLDGQVSRVGKGHQVDISLHNVPNFDEKSLEAKGFTGTFDVVARDLSNVDIVIDTISYTGKALVDNDERFRDKVHFFDKETGEELKLGFRTDYRVDVSGQPSAGTQTYDIEIKAVNGNTTNYQALTFTLGNETFEEQGYKLTADAMKEILSAESYTGKAVEKDLSKIVFAKKVGWHGSETLSPENYTVEVTGLDAGARAGKVVIKGLKSYEGCEEVYYFNIDAAKVTEVKVQKKVVFVKGYTDAAQYAPEVTVTAKSTDGTTTFTLAPEDFTVDYRFATTNMIGQNVISKVQITNKNFKGGELVFDNLKTLISKRDISTCTAVAEPGSYTYTGAVVKPTLKVMDGNEPLTEGVDYEVVSYKNAKDVGTATVVIRGTGDNMSPNTGIHDGIYDNETTLSVNYEITPANAADVKVEWANGNTETTYTGNVIKPTNFKVTLNGNDVSKQFDYVYPSTNVNVGTGHVILKPVAGNKNFTGEKDAEFQIVARELEGELRVYDENGVQYNVRRGYLYNAYGERVSFAYDGEAHTFADAKFTPTGKYAGFVTENDYEIVYIDNVYGKVVNADDVVEDGDGVAYIAVIGKGNFKGTDQIINTADEIVNVVDGAAYKFGIEKYEILKQHVTIKDGQYAAGQPVRPNVKVVVGGQTLVENRDYKLEYSAISDLTDGKTMYVSVEGINGYKGIVDGKWGVVKCDMANVQVVLTAGKKPVVTVYNAGVKVPESEYTVSYEADGVVVTAKEDSKYYTGSIKADYVAVDKKPATPIISHVEVDGNSATVILANNTNDGARGYDYVISTDPNCTENKLYDNVIKNQLNKDATFQYVQEGVYYAYCHSWVRDENNQKVFSDWSNAGRFEVYAVTPAQPKITSVKSKNGTVTVTYAASADAIGYDVVLGTKLAKVGDAGELRPVNYGTFVKKNIENGKVTATFKNVPAGTYYVGLHAYNRTRVDGKKVFSPWSESKKVTVK